MEYCIKRLGSITTLITKGTTPSNIGETFTNQGVMFFRSELIGKTKHVDKSKGLLFISEETHKKLKRSQIKCGDLLFSIAGAYLGKLSLVAVDDVPSNTNQVVALIRFKPNVCNIDYVYYYMLQEWYNEYICSFNAQAAQPNINLEQISKLKLNLPSREKQDKIASILSVYDDLIENNNKRIKILEQMAENLYKEWFVRFRFPDYQNTEFENGIPKGWKIIQVQDLFDISIGRTPDRKVFEYFSNNQSDYLWISIADMKDKMFVMSSAEYLTCDAIRKVNMPMVSENTVILSFKLSVGRVAITTQLSCTNEAIAHFNTNNKQLVEYTYLYLKFFQYQDLGNTSAIGNAVNSTIIRKMKFLYPDGEIVRVFHLQIKDVFNEIKLLSRKNQNLIKQRDMLLPRLMSGKLEV